MPSKLPSTFTQAWFKWKTLKLPWRKRFLVGLDLEGNTFWEFRDTLSSHKHRMRRIVEYPRATHYSEVKISPQWHQWLRHTRADPPSLTEQSQDLVRQRNLKMLAAQADARWAAKPSFMDAPHQSQPLPALEVKDPGGYESLQERRDAVATPETKGDCKHADQQGVKTQIPGTGGNRLNETPAHEKKKFKEENALQQDDPWKAARGGPSEEWQPQAWGGNVAARR